MMYKTITQTIAFLLLATLGWAQIDTVEMIDSEFVPADITIQEGDTVMWINMGTVVHTSTSGTNCESDGLWNSGNMDPGDAFAVIFEDPGDYPYYCIPHCVIGMTGSVTVQTTTATRTISMEDRIIHPNPVSDRFWIDLSSFESQIVDVEILNSVGQIVAQRESLQTIEEQEIPVADLERGMFYIQIKNGANIVGTQRFMKVQ